MSLDGSNIFFNILLFYIGLTVIDVPVDWSGH